MSVLYRLPAPLPNKQQSPKREWNRESAIKRLMQDFKISRDKAENAIDNGKETWRKILEDARQNRLECCNLDGDL